MLRSLFPRKPSARAPTARQPQTRSSQSQKSTLSIIQPNNLSIYDAHTHQKITLSPSKQALRKYAQDIHILIQEYPNRMLQFSELEIYQTLIDNNATLAIDKGKAVGFFQVVIWQNYLDENQLPFIELCSAIVQSEYRGKRLSQFLLRQLMAIVREKYVRHRLLAIMAEHHNPAIHKLFEHEAISVPIEPNFPQVTGKEFVYELYSKRLYQRMQKQIGSNIASGFFSSIRFAKFYDKFHCVDPECGFVQNHTYEHVTVERIQEPYKNCFSLFPNLLRLLNHITQLSFGSDEGLGEAYIAKQLKSCRQLILIRNNNGEISHYLRLDVFSDLPLSPCGLAMYRTPKKLSSSVITNLTILILKDELTRRITMEVYNPTLSLVLRTDNPKIYQMRTKLTNKIYPDLHKVKCAINIFFRQQIATLIQNGQPAEINELLQKQLILSKNRTVCHTLEDLRHIESEVELNLQALKQHKNSDSATIKLLAIEVDKVYKANIPNTHTEIVSSLIKSIFNHNDLHDYNLLIVRDATPKIRINKYKEQAHDPVINEFYHYYLGSSTRDYLMINFEINLAEINERLNRHVDRKFHLK